MFNVLANPHDLHRLATSVFEEVLAWHLLVSILSSEVDLFHVDPCEESVANTLCLELHLDIHSIVDYNVKCILESHNFICDTADCDGFLFLRLDHAIALDHFPYGVFQLCEGSVFSINLTDICNFEGLTLVYQYIDLTKVQLLLVKFDIGTAR